MPALDPLDIPDLLATLVERSLVVCDPVTGRHHMQESMRVYAHDQLGEQQAAMQRAHFEYFLSIAEEMFVHNQAQEDAKAVPPFRADVDNFRQAFEWAVVNDPHRCLRFFRCAGPTWFRFYRDEAESLAVRVLAAVPEKADNEHISIRLQMARAKMRRQSLDEARSLLDIAVQQSKETQVEPVLHTLLTSSLGILESYSGNRDLARQHTLAALNLAKKYGQTNQQASANINLGEICREAGDFQAAAEYYEEALRLSSGDVFTDALVHFNLGCTSLELNDPSKAEGYFRSALVHNMAALGVGSSFAALGGLGYICVLKKRYREAGLLMGFPEARRNSAQSRMDPLDERMFEHYRKLGLEQGGKEFEEAFKQGGALTVPEVIALVEETVDHDVHLL